MDCIRRSNRLLKLNPIIYSASAPHKESNHIDIDSFASPIKKIKDDSSCFLSPTTVTKVFTEQKKRNVKEISIKRSLEGDYSEISYSKIINSPINIKYETKRKLYAQEMDDDAMNFPLIKRNKRIKSNKKAYDDEDIAIDVNDMNDIEYIKLQKERQMILTLLYNDDISLEKKVSIRKKLGKSWANLEDGKGIENEYYQYLSLK